MEQHLRPVTRKLLYGYNKRIIWLAYQPLRLPTSFHLIARYRYALEYWTPLCSTSSNRKASSRPGSRRDSSALIPYLWINTELCTQPLSWIFELFLFFGTFFAGPPCVTRSQRLKRAQHDRASSSLSASVETISVRPSRYFSYTLDWLSRLLTCRCCFKKNFLPCEIRQLELSKLLVLPVVFLVFIYLFHYISPLLLV